ncbi:MAG TPA: bifunctional phosphopantothenoylcysteine decarboxylase/phosphopantothenate--cysteine ligase CoaBC, partial [Sediminibacterium sp.]|nr:bifunctional phosphopantothenoylcysteine decarboxylase/phosphopantothenate--cysteine ligase CoaBC [Sediminibacterium sp.]
MLRGKKILVGITGSIAAYKSVLLVRQLVQEGAEVKVIMTPAAAEFVSPLVLSTLSRNPVLLQLADHTAWSNHVMLGRWADVFVTAPLSCNTLAKMAQGICDNLLLAVYLSATCPVVLAPAMDEDMWHHPTTQRNLQQLQADGCHLIPVNHGELASGLVGEGRMAEPAEIVRYLQESFFRGGALAGKKVLVTAGPTYESIDPVRFISNHSSGKMGFALAEAFYEQGATVDLVTGPSILKTKYRGIQTVAVTTAAEMAEAALQFFPDADITVMAAAVADYTPATVADEKIKKQSGTFEQALLLKPTQDILLEMGRRRQPGQFLLGFALETEKAREHALQKLQAKNADAIVLNSLRDPAAG